MDRIFQDEKEAERQTEEALKAQALYADFKETFGTPHGRRMLLHLLSDTFMYESVFTGNSKTYHNTGKQDYGKELLDLAAAAAPEVYLWIAQQRVEEIRKMTRREFNLEQPE